jgi:hypothetical protein
MRSNNSPTSDQPTTTAGQPTNEDRQVDHHLIPQCHAQSFPSQANKPVFHLFPLLPAELRIQIWKACTHPRIVEISREPFSASRGDLEYFWSPQPVVAIQEACHESRNSGCYVKGFTLGAAPRYTWVNFSTDTIDLSQFAMNDPEMEYSRIEKLHIDVAAWDLFMDEEVLYLCRFKVLQSLRLLSPDADFEYWVCYQGIPGPHDWGCSPEKVTIVEKESGLRKSLAQCVRDRWKT